MIYCSVSDRDPPTDTRFATRSVTRSARGPHDQHRSVRNSDSENLRYGFWNLSTKCAHWTPTFRSLDPWSAVKDEIFWTITDHWYMCMPKEPIFLYSEPGFVWWNRTINPDLVILMIKMSVFNRIELVWLRILYAYNIWVIYISAVCNDILQIYNVSIIKCFINYKVWHLHIWKGDSGASWTSRRPMRIKQRRYNTICGRFPVRVWPGWPRWILQLFNQIAVQSPY